MSGPFGNRRRSFKAPVARMDRPHISLATDAMTLRKGDTFHNTTDLSPELFDPLQDLVRSPKRSNTNPASLEDLVIDAGERRVADILDKINRSSAANTDLLKDTDTPWSSYLVGRADLPDLNGDAVGRRKIKAPRTRSHAHGSDSGLGSSVSGSAVSDSIFSAVSDPSTAITKSYFAPSKGTILHVLSGRAEKEIHKHIIAPLLKDEEVKSFHRLVKNIPTRIESGNINNLRDLEKTLIFLAPDHSDSPSDYQYFCDLVVRAIRTTSQNISEADQRLPTDRPYTNAYFLDLVEQIRKYAMIMAQSREKKERGEDLDEMDYSPDETLRLEGGMSHKGEPLHFTRQKAGRTLNLDTDSDRSAAKRSLSEDLSDDDGAHRSMARRKKCEMPGAVLHKCSDCTKQFKRPCDLTKHQKTHSRPWKCSHSDCKYATLGWPTEKEAERHENDKHSSNPTYYKCLFKDCPYTSKRESNCKQHMEKAHGWEYKRSKTNGQTLKKTSGPMPGPSPAPHPLATPATPVLHTPSDLGAPHPHFPNTSAESLLPSGTPLFGSEFDFNTAPIAGPSSKGDQQFYGFGNMPLLDTAVYTPTHTHTNSDGSRRGSSALITDPNMSASHSPYTGVPFTDAGIDVNDPYGFDQHAAAPAFTMPDSSFPSSSNGFSAPTPALSTSSGNVTHAHPSSNNLNMTTSLSSIGMQNPHISPNGNGNLPLFSPYEDAMALDEGFDETLGMAMPMNPNQTFAGDFDLASGMTSYADGMDMDMIGTLPPQQQQSHRHENGYGEEEFDLFGGNYGMGQ